jgi:hypothetical protein
LCDRLFVGLQGGYRAHQPITVCLGKGCKHIADGPRDGMTTIGSSYAEAQSIEQIEWQANCCRIAIPEIATHGAAILIGPIPRPRFNR